MMIPELIDTPLSWRPLRAADLPAVAELVAAAQHLDDTAHHQDLQSLTHDFEQSVEDPASHAVVGWEGESAIAYGWNQPGIGRDGRAQVVLSGVVHPAWRYDRLGRSLFAWQLNRARRWRSDQGVAGLDVVAHADQHLGSRRRLYERQGLAPTRWFIDLHHDLQDRSPGIEVEGVEIIPWRPELSEPVRLAHYAAFAHQWGAQPVPQEQWAESLARDAARPQWSWVAVAREPDRDGSGPVLPGGRVGDLGGSVVGYALNSVVRAGGRDLGEGWTDRLGVNPQWRGRGIARALLAYSLQSFADAGLEAAGLGLDSRDNSVALYERLGYTVGDTVIRYGAAISSAGSDLDHVDGQE